MVGTLRFAHPTNYFAGYDGLAHQCADHVGRIIDFDLEHRISRLQFPRRRFGCLGGVKLRFEMAVDNRHEAIGRRPVGSYRFFRRGFVNCEDGFFHHGFFRVRYVGLIWNARGWPARTEASDDWLPIRAYAAAEVREAIGTSNV